MRSDVLQAAAAAEADTEKETVASATFNSLRFRECLGYDGFLNNFFVLKYMLIIFFIF